MRFWNFAKEEGSDEIVLRIDGEIVSDDDAWIYEWFGIEVTSPNVFRSELSKYRGQDITVWMDSWGGDVFAGVGIYNALKEHNGKITVKIDGKAVSAASLIAMAGDEVLMSPGSILMIHNPWTARQGEAKDMRQAADVLDEVKTAIVNVYEIRTKRSRDELSELMDRETWMSAKTAVAEGFADGILYQDDSSSAQNSYSLSGLAIQNSLDGALKKFIEMYQKHQATPEGNPASGWFFDIKRRVNVREKSFRRGTHE